MSVLKPTAKVPIPEAVLFIASDNADRDPDLGNEKDRGDMRTISAMEYIRARDADNPADWIKKPHRLYCPCCVEKGHLSRHKGVKAYEREEPLWNGGAAWFYFPESFHKWPDGPDHHHSCDHANRYHSLTASMSDIQTTRRELDRQLHTISLPTGVPTTTPPRPHGKKVMAQVSRIDARSYKPATKAPSLRTIEEIASFVRDTYYDPSRWQEKLLKMPEGPKSLAEVFLNNNAAVLERCQQQKEMGIDQSYAVLSLTPNRIGKYWEDNMLPSNPTGKLAVLFEGTTEESYVRLRQLFNRRESGKGLKVLAYGAVSLMEDGRPKISINRSTQVMAWQEPTIQGDLLAHMSAE